MDITKQEEKMAEHATIIDMVGKKADEIKSHNLRHQVAKVDIPQNAGTIETDFTVDKKHVEVSITLKKDDAEEKIVWTVRKNSKK